MGTTTPIKHQLDIKTFMDFKRTEVLAGDSVGKELRMITTFDEAGAVSTVFEVASRIIVHPGEGVSWDSFKTRLLDEALKRYNDL